VRVATQHGSSDVSDDAALLALFGLSLHVIAARSREGWARRSAWQAVRFVSRRAAKLPAPTSLPRFVTTSTPVTRRCASLRPRINENSPSRWSRKVLMCARATDVDANGKSVAAAASNDWVRQLLDTP
jgi:hypothetical protein